MVEDQKCQEPDTIIELNPYQLISVTTLKGDKCTKFNKSSNQMNIAEMNSERGLMYLELNQSPIEQDKNIGAISNYNVKPPVELPDDIENFQVTQTSFNNEFDSSRIEKWKELNRVDSPAFDCDK